MNKIEGTIIEAGNIEREAAGSERRRGDGENAEAERTKWMSKKPTIYDETVRLEQATTTAPAKCECLNWCSDGLHRREELLAGHHFRCSKFDAEFRRRALELMTQLYEDMRECENKEDGVPIGRWAMGWGE